MNRVQGRHSPVNSIQGRNSYNIGLTSLSYTFLILQLIVVFRVFLISQLIVVFRVCHIQSRSSIPGIGCYGWAQLVNNMFTKCS